MRNDLRYGRAWLTFGWFAVIVALILNLLPAKDLHGIHIDDKVEHIVGYVLLTLCFCGIYPRTRYWVIVLGFIAMGAIVEVLQGAMQLGRSEDIHDLYADTLGIAIGLLLAWAGFNQWPRWIERLFKRT